MEVLEEQKADMEADLSRLRIAQGIQLTEAEVRAWLKKFCTGDPMDEEFRKRIIDVFINSVYLYDDRLVVFYNIRGGKQVSYIDLINSADLPADVLPLESSAVNDYAPPHNSSHQPVVVFCLLKLESRTDHE